jgi:hypothetical protein
LREIEASKGLEITGIKGKPGSAIKMKWISETMEIPAWMII